MKKFYQEHTMGIWISSLAVLTLTVLIVGAVLLSQGVHHHSNGWHTWIVRERHHQTEVNVWAILGLLFAAGIAINIARSD